MAAATTAQARPRREREEELLVWPDLVFVEFIAAVLFSFTFLVISSVVNAPLINRANAAPPLPDNVRQPVLVRLDQVIQMFSSKEEALATLPIQRHYMLHDSPQELHYV